MSSSFTSPLSPPKLFSLLARLCHGFSLRFGLRVAQERNPTPKSSFAGSSFPPLPLPNSRIPFEVFFFPVGISYPSSCCCLAFSPPWSSSSHELYFPSFGHFFPVRDRFFLLVFCCASSLVAAKFSPFAERTPVSLPCCVSSFHVLPSPPSPNFFWYRTS